MWKASVLSAFEASVLQRPTSQATPTPNSYTLLPDAQRFLTDLVSIINTAQSSVDMQFYTFEDDGAGRPIAQALIDAHMSRGVKVRLMVDDYINLAHNDYYIRVPRLDRSLQRSIVQEWKSTLALLEQMRNIGIKVQMINPRGVLLHRMFLRDHKKLVVVDADTPGGGLAYTGGINPSDHNAVWNDFMVRMRGGMVPLLSQDFERTWSGRNGGGIVEYDGGLVVADARRHSLIIPIAQHLIHYATESVMIETAYLWGKGIAKSLAAAARMGRKVTVTVPLNNNHRFFVPTKRMLDALIDAGVHVYRFTESGGMTHAKALIVDDVALFGSNNFNEFLAGKIGEIGIVTDDTDVVGKIRDFMLADVQRSLPHTH